MAQYTKNIAKQICVLQWTTTSNNRVVAGYATVANALSGYVGIQLGRVVSNAFTTAGGPVFRVEGVLATTANVENRWFPLFQGQMAIGANIAARALTELATAGTNHLKLTTTNLAVGDIIHIKDAVASTGEFHRVVKVSTNVGVWTEDNFKRAHASNTSVVYDQSEFWGASIDLAPFNRIRVLVNGAAANRNLAFQAHMNYASTIA